MAGSSCPGRYPPERRRRLTPGKMSRALWMQIFFVVVRKDGQAKFEVGVVVG